MALVPERPAPALADLAAERDARFIVVGSYGERPIRGALLGLRAAQADAARAHAASGRPRAALATNRATPPLARLFRLMSTYEKLAGLPLEVEGYEPRAARAGGLQRLHARDHGHPPARRRARGRRRGRHLRRARPRRAAGGGAGAGARRAHGRSARSSTTWAALDLFPAEPVRDTSRLFRRWAFESAALDLALRQGGITLADALGRELRPVTFVVSLRLGKPADARAGQPPPRPLPEPAVQARPDRRMDRRADRAAGRHRRGRLGRPQGVLHRHGRRQPAGAGALPARSPRRSPTRGSRIPA